MRSYLVISLLVLAHTSGHAQKAFKAGWKTYNTGLIIHEINYDLVSNDSLRAIDSTTTFVSDDSLVSMRQHFNKRDRSTYKTVNYLNEKKQLVKTEEYKNDYLYETDDYKYDNQNRKTHSTKHNKDRESEYKKVFSYASDKKTGETVVTECSYFNSKVEYYTKSYFNKKDVKYKEVRLNDNNKDIIHVETYTYGENGKVSSRSVYFPEFKVTKNFEEPSGKIAAKCFGVKPTGAIDKIGPSSRTPYIKRVLQKHKSVLSDAACNNFEYTFTNSNNCAITIATLPEKSGSKTSVCYRYKEKF